MQEENTTIPQENPLGTRPLAPLLFSLAVPAIVANVVNALYNIVDQIFIGQGVGYLGNAATSVAFPLTTICMAIGLMAGLGSASGFNLELGRKNEDKAKSLAGTAASTVLIAGIVICVAVRLFLEPLLGVFGATGQIMPYAKTYAEITSFGIPFLLFSTGINPLVRADRSPRYSMMAIVSGAVLNTILDPIFIFAFGWGIAGAAWATVISQVLSAVILMCYFPRFKSVKFTARDFIPHASHILTICKLGLNSFVFQFSNLVVQVTLNNTLRIYGAGTVYESDIPIAAAGIVMKVNVIFVALIIGLINGAQPICSYNYGAQKYERVRGTVRLFMRTAFIISVALWLCFEIFPRQLVGIFGNGGENSQLYFDFAARFMRVYLFFTFLNGMRICTSTYLPAIGKAAKGAAIAFVYQLGLIVPFMLIFPRFFGLDGVMYSTPTADAVAFVFAMVLLWDDLRKMPKGDGK
mgnify:CR=1 FL=1